MASADKIRERPSTDSFALLKAISFSALLHGESDAISDLYSAGIEGGFFYLDLRSLEIEMILDEVNKLYGVAEDFFQLPLEEKMTFDLDIIGPHKIDGYKPAGRNTGIAKGKQDGFEIYLIPRNGLFELDPSQPFICPPKLEPEKPLIANFMDTAHWIGTTLLMRFSQCLGLDSSMQLQQNHRSGKLSTSALGLLKYLPLSSANSQGIGKLGQIAHTDVGSITLLFSRLGGLQVMEPSTGRWRFVEPKAGHAIVNVGDSLHFLSGKVLCSSLHRVVPHPDSERKTRYSIAYFMRPEFNAQINDDEGTHWTGLGWHTRKFAVFRAPLEEQKKNSVLTGRHGYVGLWNDNEAEGV